jgi:hypothetical protein
LKKKWFDHGKALRKCFEESKSLFNVDKQLLLDCIDKYNVFNDDNRQHVKECKIINNFLSEMHEGSLMSIELRELENLQKSENIKWQQRLQVINDFVTAIKQECVIN